MSSFLGTQGLLYIILAGSLLLYIVDLYLEENTRKRIKNKVRNKGADIHQLIVILTLLVVLSATFSMVMSSQMHTITVESKKSVSSNKAGIESGETFSTDVNIPNSGFIPVYVFFNNKTKNIHANPDTLFVGSREIRNSSISIKAPNREGRFNEILSENRYVAILPMFVIEPLYKIHSWIPIIVIDIIVGSLFYIFTISLLGKGRVCSYSKNKKDLYYHRLKVLLNIKIKIYLIISLFCFSLYLFYLGLLFN